MKIHLNFVISTLKTGGNTMYVNAAYLNNYLPEIIDETIPLKVTSCGNYKMKSRDVFQTRRDKGRGDYQILYVDSGKGHFFIDGKEHIVPAGNMVIYYPNSPQLYRYYCKDKTSVYWVHFTGAHVQAIFDHYNIPRESGVIHSGVSPDYQWLFSQIIRELQTNRTKSDEMLTLLLINILMFVNRSLEMKTKFADTTEKEITYAMYHFRENFNKEINIDDYARECNISVCWFIRCFKQVTGQTPLQYIISLRISNAQMLLETTDYTIAQIAQEVGYDNPLYFSRLFHKQTGVSPNQYRKKLRYI